MKKFYILIGIIICLIIVTSCDKLPNIPGLNMCKHEYEVSKVITEATCSKEGSVEKTCSKCGNVIISTITKKDHSYGDFVITKPTSCKEAGEEQRECSICHHIDSKKIDALAHQYEYDDVDATCTEPGGKKATCKVCGHVEIQATSLPIGHIWGEYKETIPAGEYTEGEAERECKLCHIKETKVLVKTKYIDTTVLEFGLVDNTTVYPVSNEDELSLVFNAACLYMLDKVSVRLNFEVTDLQKLVDNLSSHYEMEWGYSMSASLKGKDLTLSMNYPSSPEKMAANKDAYVQYDNIFKNHKVSHRDVSFDDFKINNKTLVMNNVRTSDQLVYALEHGAKPICVAGSAAEKVYNEMKMILRGLVDDSFSDFQKVRAIHDWVIMNVCYDDDLLKLTTSSTSGISNYRGFYLEGAIFDHRAVCEGMAKTVMCLCQIEGIKSVVVSGYQTKNPGGVGHAWNKVLVDDVWYIVDATSDGTIINSTYEILSYKYFMISDETFSVKYTAKDHLDIKCDVDYNPYQYITYQYLMKDIDLVISTQYELNELMTYFVNNSSKGMTCQFLMDFDFGDSVGDELTKAFTLAGKSFKYIDDGKIITVVNE